MRIPLKFHIYFISNVRFKCFRFHVHHFDFWLNSHRIVHRAMLLSAAVTLASSKTNAATLNLLPKVIYALWFNGHQVYHIFPKNPQPHLHFQWRTSTTGWTISKISTSFHQALMVLGIRRSAMANSDGQLRYSRKTKRGCNLAPHAVRGLRVNWIQCWVLAQMVTWKCKRLYIVFYNRESILFFGDHKLFQFEKPFARILSVAGKIDPCYHTNHLQRV